MKCLGLLLATVASGVSNLRHIHHHQSSFVKALAFKHRLRVCNAYPFAQGFDIFRDKTENLTDDDSLNYKQCRDFKIALKAGDRLEFKVGDSNAGTFSISDLPNNDAILLLVIYRHDTLSTAVSFESHVFANLLNAQIAVIDTFKGAKRSSLKIQDHSSSKTSRTEELRYDSVVAVNPGKYEVLLDDAEGNEKSKAGLIALNRESYVVIRSGVDAQNNDSFPQELIVFPQSDEKLLGGAHLISFTLALLGAMLWQF